MTRFAGMWFIIAASAVSTGLLAQERLPKTLAGEWRGINIASRHNEIGGPMSVTIEKQNPDGSIEGKITFQTKACEVSDDPVTGKFDGQVLTLQIAFRERFPSAHCGRPQLILKKGADGRFEGEIPGSAIQLKASLAPK
jgi:hypothetical protein